MKKVWKWIKDLFSSGTAKSILSVFLKTTSGTALAILKDEKIGQKAIELVKELNKNKELSGKEKAEIFNKQMGEWLKLVGKAVGTALLNLIREMAVQAVQAAIIAAVAEGKEIEDK